MDTIKGCGVIALIGAMAVLIGLVFSSLESEAVAASRSGDAAQVISSHFKAK